jgi:hypothetical protein
MNTIFYPSVVAIACALVVGCSKIPAAAVPVVVATPSPTPTPDDPLKPSKEHFKAALDQYYASQPPLTIDIQSEFPATLPERETGPRRQMMKALVSAGLVSEEEGDEPIKYYNPIGTYLFTKTEPGEKYSLTDLGRKYYSTTEQYNTTYSHFTYGRYAVRELSMFTIPSEGFGQTMSEVHYSYQDFTLPTWARNWDLEAVFPQLKSDVEHYYPDTKVFVLTSEGWQIQQ